MRIKNWIVDHRRSRFIRSLLADLPVHQAVNVYARIQLITDWLAGWPTLNTPLSENRTFLKIHNSNYHLFGFRAKKETDRKFSGCFAYCTPTHSVCATVVVVGEMASNQWMDLEHQFNEHDKITHIQPTESVRSFVVIVRGFRVAHICFCERQRVRTYFAWKILSRPFKMAICLMFAFRQKLRQSLSWKLLILNHRRLIFLLFSHHNFFMKIFRKRIAEWFQADDFCEHSKRILSSLANFCSLAFFSCLSRSTRWLNQLLYCRALSP